MADEIQADYDKLGQVASKFANQAQATSDMTRKVRAAMQKLEQGGWMGRRRLVLQRDERGGVAGPEAHGDRAADGVAGLEGDLAEDAHR